VCGGGRIDARSSTTLAFRRRGACLRHAGHAGTCVHRPASRHQACKPAWPSTRARALPRVPARISAQRRHGPCCVKQHAPYGHRRSRSGAASAVQHYVEDDP
jgi:hypothetical protein